MSFKDLKVEAHYTGDSLNVQALGVDVFRGNVSAAPIVVTGLSGVTPRFESQLTVKNLNLEQLLKETSSDARPKKSVSGTLNSALSLSGEGAVWDQLAPSLEGRGELSLTQGALHNLDPEAAIINELARALPAPLKGAVKRKRPRPLKLKRLEGAFELSNGELAFKEPLKLNTAEGELSLAGALGLNLNARLQGELALDPKRLSAHLKRPVPQKTPIKVPFKVDGPLSDPKVSGVGVAALVGVVALALGGGELTQTLTEGAEALKSKGKEALKSAKGEVKRRVKSAKRAAKRQIEAGKERAQEEVEEAKREAKARAEEAKREAEELKEKAKSKLKGLF